MIKQQSLQYSFYITLSYVLVGFLYIFASTEIAHSLATSQETLAYIERVKGLAFVFITTGALFAFSYLLFCHINTDHNKILQQRETLLEAEKHATASLLAASLANDAGNILHNLKSCIKALEKTSTANADNQQLIDTMKQAIANLSALNQRLTKTGEHSTTGELVETDLMQEVQNTINLALANERMHGCDIALKGPDSLVFKMNALLVNEMVLNLILNAADAIEEKGNILVQVAIKDDIVTLEVHDDGPGIPTAQQETIFDAFYTTKSQGRGLGLLSVKACAQLHKGSVAVSHSELGGAVFRIKLPFNSKEPAENFL